MCAEADHRLRCRAGCIFEGGVSRLVLTSIAQAEAQGEADRFEATQRTAPKLRRVTDGGLLELVEVDASKELSALLDELRVQLDAGAFTGRGDKDVVMAMLETFAILLKKGIKQAAVQQEQDWVAGLRGAMKMMLGGRGRDLGGKHRRGRADVPVTDGVALASSQPCAFSGPEVSKARSSQRPMELPVVPSTVGHVRV